MFRIDESTILTPMMNPLQFSHILIVFYNFLQSLQQYITVN